MGTDEKTEKEETEALEEEDPEFEDYFHPFPPIPLQTQSYLGQSGGWLRSSHPLKKA